MSERRLPDAEAISRLPDGDKIHTFRQGDVVLAGADWDRADIIEAILRYGAEETGETAQKMNHGIAVKDSHGWLFIETKKCGAQ